MTAFVIAEVKVTDDAWMPEYVSVVHDIAARHGGKYLSRSANLTAIEGVPSDVTVIALPELHLARRRQGFCRRSGLRAAPEGAHRR